MGDVPSPDPARIAEVLRGVGALASTARCYKRPNSKLDPDPGPCGRCAACMARAVWYEDATDGAPLRADIRAALAGGSR